MDFYLRRLFIEEDQWSSCPTDRIEILPDVM